METEQAAGTGRCSAVAVEAVAVVYSRTSAAAVLVVGACIGCSAVAIEIVGACIGSSVALKPARVRAEGTAVQGSSEIADDRSVVDLAHIAVEDNTTGHVVAVEKQPEPSSRRLWHIVRLQRDSLHELHSFLELLEQYELGSSLD